MIYNSSEAVQLLVLGVCFALALIRALRVRNAAWIEVTCFFACMFLGNVYWYGYLSVFGETPGISYISDLNWISGYIFLLMLLIECDQQRGLAAPVRAAWIPVAACAACCAYYIYVNGYPILNLIDNGLLAAIGFFSMRGLAARSAKDLGECLSHNRALHVAALAFIVVEQALWISSLLPDPESNYLAYSIMNHLLTLSYVAILVTAWRSEDL